MNKNHDYVDLFAFNMVNFDGEKNTRKRVELC